ncbi:hypothetical protein [Mycobacterium tuberculosis]|nr:hypothetical protein [Mycobacterium tuberculosis]
MSASSTGAMQKSFVVRLSSLILAELGWKPGRPTLEEMIEDARAFHARRC